MENDFANNMPSTPEIIAGNGVENIGKITTSSNKKSNALVIIVLILAALASILIYKRYQKRKSHTSPQPAPPSQQPIVMQPVPQPQQQQQQDPRYGQAVNKPYHDNKLEAYSSGDNNGQLLQLDEGRFNKLVIQQQQPALVAFTMAGCGHCERMKPAFAEAASKAKIALALLDKSNCSDALLRKYNVQGFPTILLFRSGEVAQAYNGDRSVDSFVKFAQ